MSEVTLSRVKGLDAAAAGGRAFRAGKKMGDCPHKADEGIEHEFLAHCWMRGFRYAAADAGKPFTPVTEA